MVDKNILCFQSSVLQGKVGNNVARDAYLITGAPVIFMDTVHFSGTASKKHFGVIFESDKMISHFRECFEYLYQEGKCDVLHTGYMGSGKQVLLVESLLKDKKVKPSLFMLDPVLGDDGQYYVRKDVQDTIHSLLPYADIITPNIFELGHLVGETLKNDLEVRRACQKLFSENKFLKAIILTSDDYIDSVKGNTITSQIFFRNQKLVKLTTLRTKTVVKGCGDLFASILASRISQKEELGKAIEEAFLKTALVARLTENNQDEFINIRQFLPEANDIYNNYKDLLLIKS